jgi:Cu(I)/Ag(I) efflux system membrane protein CusA/SilA
MTRDSRTPDGPDAGLARVIRFCLDERLVVLLGLIFVIAWGLRVAPFDWELWGMPRSPVPTDAIPDISENQQIVFTEWPGRSPQDVQDRVTYPLSSSLLGVSGVKEVRATSMFGFSSIYVIFEEGVDFDTSRNRLLIRLSSLPAGMPEGVTPQLGPEATAVGQIFWYTLEGRDADGNLTPGIWALHELRTVQDWYLKYDLLASRTPDGEKPIAEVASVGGYVREYHVDVDPAALRIHGVTLSDVFRAVRESNLDVGARTIEVNNVEYFVRGVGYVERIEDIAESVVVARQTTPIRVRHVATVTLGPALRRGALDKEGAEAVGGVAVVRYGENPLAAIQAVKARLGELGALRHDADGKPFWLLRGQTRELPGGGRSHVAVVPFYDRTGLIYETLDTLNEALVLEVLVTVLVVLVMIRHLRSSLLISSMLPLAILICFVAMKQVGVDANVVALSGIAIAIGTIVDMGIILCENVLEHLDAADPDEPRRDVVFRAAREVGGAIFTAVATTVVSFLPVFAMSGAEGKLFRPLAFTKTFALIASVLVALLVIPAGARLLLRRRSGEGRWFRWSSRALQVVVLIAVVVLLARTWHPLGIERSLAMNTLFIVLAVGGVLLGFHLFRWAYPWLLRRCLAWKPVFLLIPAAVIVLGVTCWLGFGALTGVDTPDSLADADHVFERIAVKFPGLGREFMPPLDEGSFLLMPSTMPHASFGQCLELLRQVDMAIKAIPEVDDVVGKIGRADSPLDPAPISMIETVVTYKPEFRVGSGGERIRQWRPSIRTPDDIWDAVAAAADLPALPRASKLQPIITRIVMLQSGMRAKLGVKVYGPGQASIQNAAIQIERLLKQVPAVEADTVAAERLVGKPYLEIRPDRAAAARYGLNVQDVQDVIETAIGGRVATRTVEGRESYAIRVRYPRELRNQIDTLGSILVPAPNGVQVPLVQVTNLRDLDAVYRRGPVAIRSEDAKLVSYVTFDSAPGRAEVEVVEACRRRLDAAAAAGELALPKGVSYRFAGQYENQVRARRTLAVVLPLALFLIVMILYLQFRRLSTTLIVFGGIAVAWAGGFVLLWLYGEPWFLDVSVFGVNLRTLFQIGPVNLSVAVWVGFLALFGIATDDGVVMATYLEQSFRRRQPETRQGVREAVVAAARRRIRPCLMTSATTILALLPVLSSTGRGSDVMVPMAIPVFGGMIAVLLAEFLTPVLYATVHELRVGRSGSSA